MTKKVRDSVEEDSMEMPEGDVGLAERANPGWRVICLESFMYKSRNSYPLTWLVREIVQNFTDANAKEPGTLNGVNFEIEDSPSGAAIITITGEWPFTDHGNLTTFGSAKTDESVASAGGNGIGLKQTVLRLMRDFDVNDFKVTGEGWEVSYKMTSAEAAGSKQGALMARANKSDNKGRNTYRIETQDPEVIEAFKQFKNLGVCDDNEYLKDMHFKSKFGGIKWLPIAAMPVDPDGKEKFKAEKGRLFMNGQIFRYEENSFEKNDDFWGELSGVSVQLNNVNYPMTLDRPPINRYQLDSLMHGLVQHMKKGECLQNLIDSEHLWTNLEYKKYNYDKPTCFNVINEIVDLLSRWRFTVDDYEEAFGSKKFLCKDFDLTDEQHARLKGEGYTLCPDFFGKIHMPKASALFSDVEMAARTKPDVHKVKDARFSASMNVGVNVPYEEIQLPTSAKKLGAYARARLSNVIRKIERNGSKVRILLNGKIDKDDLIDHQHPPAKFGAMIVHVIRGLAYAGLASGKFEDIYMAQGEYISSFAEHNGGLIVRNTKAETNDVYFEITSDDAENFYAGLTDTASTKKESVQKETPKVTAKPRGYFRYLKVPTQVISSVGAGVAFILAVDMGLDKLNKMDMERIGSELQAADGIKDYSTVELDISQRKPRSLDEIWASNGSPDRNSLTEEYNRTVKAAGGYNWKKDLRKFLSLSDDSGTDNYTVADFEIEKNPDEKQLEQLQILKEYFFLTTGYKSNDKLFIYRGAGAYGLHSGGTISIHENTLKYAGFEQAVATFAHESAHDRISDHNSDFASVMSAFQAEIENTLGEIARKNESELTDVDKKILSMEGRWNELQK